jgi:hypothetical protein
MLHVSGASQSSSGLVWTFIFPKYSILEISSMNLEF